MEEKVYFNVFKCICHVFVFILVQCYFVLFSIAYVKMSSKKRWQIKKIILKSFQVLTNVNMFVLIEKAKTVESFPLISIIITI